MIVCGAPGGAVVRSGDLTSAPRLNASAIVLMPSKTAVPTATAVNSAIRALPPTNRRIDRVVLRRVGAGSAGLTRGISSRRQAASPRAKMALHEGPSPTPPPGAGGDHAAAARGDGHRLLQRAAARGDGAPLRRA